MLLVWMGLIYWKNTGVVIPDYYLRPFQNK